MRVALGLEYFGGPYAGWQSQRDGRGVQDALERALAAIANSDVRAIAAGRTDARVHATMQVVHFDTGAVRPVTAWVRGVNANLPPDIGFLGATVAEGFHRAAPPRRATMVYALVNRPVRLRCLRTARAGYHRRSTSPGCSKLHGSRRTHDFFRIPGGGCQARTPTRR